MFIKKILEINVFSMLLNVRTILFGRLQAKNILNHVYTDQTLNERLLGVVAP